MYICDKEIRLMVALVAKCGFKIDNYRPDPWIVSLRSIVLIKRKK